MQSGLIDQSPPFCSIRSGGHKSDLPKRAEGDPLKPSDSHRTEPARDTMVLQIQAEEFRLYLIIRRVNYLFLHP